MKFKITSLALCGFLLLSLVAGGSLSAQTGTDVPGEDLPDVPRYPEMIRMYHYAVDSSKLLMYYGVADVSTIKDFYKREMPVKGWSLAVEGSFDPGTMPSADIIDFLTPFMQLFMKAPPPEGIPAEPTSVWMAGFQKGDARALVAVAAAEGRVYVIIAYVPSVPGAEEYIPPPYQPPETEYPGEDLPDIPLYPGMVRTYYWESEREKSIGYEGRVAFDDVVNFYVTQMLDYGWKLDFKSQTSGRCELGFSKKDAHVFIAIWAGDGYTIVDIYLSVYAPYEPPQPEYPPTEYPNKIVLVKNARVAVDPAFEDTEVTMICIEGIEAGLRVVVDPTLQPNEIVVQDPLMVMVQDIPGDVPPLDGYTLPGGKAALAAVSTVTVGPGFPTDLIAGIMVDRPEIVIDPTLPSGKMIISGGTITVLDLGKVVYEPPERPTAYTPPYVEKPPELPSYREPEYNKSADMDVEMVFKSTGHCHVKARYCESYSWEFTPIAVGTTTYEVKRSKLDAKINIKASSPGEKLLAISIDGEMTVPEEGREQVGMVAATPLSMLNAGLKQQVGAALERAKRQPDFPLPDLEVVNIAVTKLDWNATTGKLKFGLTATLRTQAIETPSIRRLLPLSIEIVMSGTFESGATYSSTVDAEIKFESPGATGKFVLRNTSEHSDRGSASSVIFTIDALFGLSRVDDKVVCDLSKIKDMKDILNILILPMYAVTPSPTPPPEGVREETLVPAGEVSSSIGTSDIMASVLRELFKEVPELTAKLTIKVPSGVNVSDLPAGYKQVGETYTWTGTSAIDAIVLLLTGQSTAKISYTVTPYEAQPPVTVRAENLRVGESAKVQFREDQLVVDANITAKQVVLGVPNTSITQKQLSEAPENIPKPPGLVHGYVEINATAMVDNIKVKVQKLWEVANNIDKDTIKVLRYENERWAELPTSFENEDYLYLYYRAQTGGTSLFAVTAKVSVPPAVAVGVSVVAIISIICGVFIVIFVVAWLKRMERETARSLKRLKVGLNRFLMRK